MASRLFSLFGTEGTGPEDLVAGEAQSLSTISPDENDQAFVTSRFLRSRQVEPKVDYSDFSNFVFFNSALDYFNISAEKILNEYPYDGSRASLEGFLSSIDGYQRYLLSVWPKSTGHLRFNPSVSSSYVTVVDNALVVDDPSVGDTQRVGALSPGTGSVAIEFWASLSQSSATNSSMFVVQKTSASLDGYSVYVSASQVYFRVVSGSATSEISVPFSNGNLTYFAFVYDRTSVLSPVLVSYTGSATSFPRTVSYVTSSILGPINIGNFPLYIGSGTLAGKSSQALSGNIGEMRIWSQALDKSDLSGSFNVSAYAQQGLMGLWRFNESGNIPNNDGNNSLVFDSSGHKLNGKIASYWSGIRGSGSLIPYSRPEPLLSAYFNHATVQNLISLQQTSGSLYDRENDNLILRLLPEGFVNLELEQGTTVLRDLLYILGRNFDQIKVSIDQFVNVLRSGYSDFDQTPDALLSEIAAFFGWEFTGNFLTADAFQYILGKGVLANQESNRELDVTLIEIKNEFWRRTLANLLHIYKTKGTRESVETLLRVYGLNKNFVRLKEYGYRPNVGIQTNRIHADKGAYVLMFSGSAGPTVVSSPFSGVPLSVETHVMFPTSASAELFPTLLTGSVWSLNSTQLSGGLPSGSQVTGYQMFWTKNVATDLSGTVFVTGTEGTVSTGQIGIFDGRWYNLTFFRDPVSGTLALDVLNLDYDTVTRVALASSSFSVVTGTLSYSLVVGASGSTGSQMYANEVRVWDQALSNKERFDHAYNYQSYGLDDILDPTRPLVHWRLWENVSSSAGGTFNIDDVSLNLVSGSAANFKASSSSYRKFLFDYNYIASPDMGWVDDKIRVYDKERLTVADVVEDNPTVGLEFNMVDALNEDISQMISALDGFDNSVGLPANRFRSEYHDVSFLRRKYFARLRDRLNFRVFFDMLDFFDRNFVTMVKRLIPIGASFLGDELVVESHMLERPKLQWNYRRQPSQFVVEGSIKIISRR